MRVAAWRALFPGPASRPGRRPLIHATTSITPLLLGRGRARHAAAPIGEGHDMRNIIRIGAGTDRRNRFVAIALGVALAVGPAAMLPAAALAAPATDAAASFPVSDQRVHTQAADGEQDERCQGQRGLRVRVGDHFDVVRFPQARQHVVGEESQHGRRHGGGHPDAQQHSLAYRRGIGAMFLLHALAPSVRRSHAGFPGSGSRTVSLFRLRR